MFTGKLLQDVDLLPQLLDKRLNEKLKSCSLLESGKISEDKMIDVYRKTIDEITQDIKTYYRKNHRSKLNELTDLVDARQCEYQLLLQKEIITHIGKKHKKLIMKNLPKTMTKKMLRKHARPYSNQPRKGVNSQALLDYLKACVFMYRTGLNKQPLMRLISYLETDDKVFKWLKNSLRDDTAQVRGELWATGFHEWLPCNLILDVVKRSAGMVKGVTPFVVSYQEGKYTAVDWITIHKQMRSPIKRLYFLNEENTVESGHVPAIRSDIKDNPLIGAKVSGTVDFHQALNDAFIKSTSPREFVRRVSHISHDSLITGSKHLLPSATGFFTVEGVTTNSERKINNLRHAKIRNAYKIRKSLFSFFSDLTVNDTEGDEIESLSDSLTEYSDYDYSSSSSLSYSSD
jgi:hypothetical protein